MLLKVWTKGSVGDNFKFSLAAACLLVCLRGEEARWRWCGVRDAIHSLRWSGSKNKQGFLSLTPFTGRVMSLGPVMGAFLSLATGVKLTTAGSLYHLIGAYTASVPV